MKSVKFFGVSLAMLLCLFLAFGCSDDDDNGTGPVNTNIPSELVGTWNFYSATFDGVPQNFPDISNTDSSQTASLTFNSGNTWSMAEYYNSVTVYTQSGTCTNIGHVLTVLTTMEQGAPLNPPDTFQTNWLVSGSNLIMTDSVFIMSDTMIVIQTYVKD